MEKNEEMLEHHGIKGQKWGVRRFQNEDGTRTAAGKKHEQSRSEDPAHDDYNKAHSGKNVKDMSDAELRSRLNRLQMEKQYSQLTDSDTSKGKKFVSDAMKVAKVATTVATVSTTALTIYNNYGKIKKIVDGKIKKQDQEDC